MDTIQQLERTVQQVRRDILRMVHKVNSGHPGVRLAVLNSLWFCIRKLWNTIPIFQWMALVKTYSFFPMGTSHRFITAFLQEVVFSCQRT